MQQCTLNTLISDYYNFLSYLAKSFLTLTSMNWAKSLKKLFSQFDSSSPLKIVIIFYLTCSPDPKFAPRIIVTICDHYPETHIAEDEKEQDLF